MVVLLNVMTSKIMIFYDLKWTIAYKIYEIYLVVKIDTVYAYWFAIFTNCEILNF